MFLIDFPTTLVLLGWGHLEAHWDGMVFRRKWQTRDRFQVVHRCCKPPQVKKKRERWRSTLVFHTAGLPWGKLLILSEPTSCFELDSKTNVRSRTHGFIRWRQPQLALSGPFPPLLSAPPAPSSVLAPQPGSQPFHQHGLHGALGPLYP